jgi:hypothetical protein
VDLLLSGGRRAYACRGTRLAAVAYRAYHPAQGLRDVYAAVAVVVAAKKHGGDMAGARGGRRRRGGNRGSLRHGDGAEQHRSSDRAGTSCANCQATGRGK